MCNARMICCVLAAMAVIAWGVASAVGGTITVSAVSGGDAGEGLDMDGNFLYALDIGGPGGEHVRDVSFAEPVGPGMTVEHVFALENQFGVSGHWVKPEFGDTANDNALEDALGYAGYATGTTAVSIHLSQDGGAKLVEGMTYSLQIMVMERTDLAKGSHYMDLVYWDMSTGTPTGPLLLADNFCDAADSLATGSVLTYDFVATAGDANEFFIELYSASAYGEIPSGNYYDDPYLSAVTLKQVPEPSMMILLGAAAVILMLARTRRQNKV